MWFVISFETKVESEQFGLFCWFSFYFWVGEKERKNERGVGETSQLQDSFWLLSYSDGANHSSHHVIPTYQLFLPVMMVYLLYFFVFHYIETSSLMQVLVYHDLLGMLQHPHHAKVGSRIAILANIFFSPFN